MNTISTSILNQHLQHFVDKKIAEGKYANVTEVITASLELLEKQELQDNQLQAAITEGIVSGIDYSFNPQENLLKLKRKLKDNV